MARKIIDLVAALTLESKQFERGMAQAAKSGQAIDKQFRNSQRQTLGFAKSASRAGVSSNRLATGLLGVAKSAAKVGATVGAAATALGVLAQQGGRVVTMTDAFQRFSGSARGLQELRSASRGLISDFQILESFNRGVALGAVRTRKEFAQLTEVAIVLGRAMNQSAAFSLESLTLGIGRQSRLFLDNLGLIVKVEEAYRRYAIANNLVAESLTEAQQKEAFRIEALRVAQREMDKLGDIALNAGDEFTILQNSIKNVKDELLATLARSGRLAGVFRGLRTSAISYFTGVSAATQGLTDQLTLQGIRAETPEDIAELERLRDVLQRAVDVLPVLNTELTGFEDTLHGASTAAGIMFDAIKTGLANVAGFITGTTEFTGALAAVLTLPEGNLREVEVKREALNALIEDTTRLMTSGSEASIAFNQAIEDGVAPMYKLVQLADRLGVEVDDAFRVGAEIGFVESLRDGADSLRRIGLSDTTIAFLDKEGVRNAEQLFNAQARIMAIIREAPELADVKGINDAYEALERLNAIIEMSTARIEDMNDEFSNTAIANLTLRELVDLMSTVGDEINAAQLEMARATNAEQYEESRAKIGALGSVLDQLYDDLNRRTLDQSGFLPQFQDILDELTSSDVPALMRELEELEEWKSRTFRSGDQSIGVGPGNVIEEIDRILDLKAAVLDAQIAIEGADAAFQRFNLQMEQLGTFDFRTDTVDRFESALRGARFAARSAIEVLKNKGGEGTDAMLELEQVLADIETQLRDLKSPAVKFTEAVTKVAKGDVLGGLTDAFEGFKNAFNPETLLADLGSGLADFAVGLKAKVIEGIGTTLKEMAISIFAEDPSVAQREMFERNTRALQENTDALQRSLRSMSGMGLANIQGALAMAVRSAEASTSARGKPDEILIREIIKKRVQEFGLSLQDLEDLFAKANMEVQYLPESLRLLRDAILDLYDDLDARMRSADARIQFLDIEDPAEQFAMKMNAMIASLPEGSVIRDALQNLGIDEIAQFGIDMLNTMEAGILPVFEELGDVSPEDFISFLLEMDQLADAAEGAADGLGELSEVLRNVPTGFKVALERFRADTGVFPNQKGGFTDDVDTIISTSPFDIPMNDGTPLDTKTGQTGGVGSGGPVGETVNIVIQEMTVVADSPEDFMNAIVEEERRQARRGGVTELQLATTRVKTSVEGINRGGVV